MLKKTISLFLLLLSPLFLWATHNRAGEIIYERIGTTGNNFAVVGVPHF